MNTLPQAIAAYIQATNAWDFQAVAACFTPDATVRDEGHTHRGRTAIGAWAEDTGERYRATMEATGLEHTGDMHTLRAAVRGSFPGSPVILHFGFVLRDGAIANLEVAP